MNRKEAISIVLAEAFAENGLAALAHDGQDAGSQRLKTLIAAVQLLSVELSREDVLDRTLVAALFAVGTNAPDDLKAAFSPTADSRSTLVGQLNELRIAVWELIEGWENWPSEESFATYDLHDPTDADLSSDPVNDQFEGYRVGDITYCVVDETKEFFPVKVIRLGFNVIEVEGLFTDRCRNICAPFLEDRLSRCFQPPELPPFARFGGFEESCVNHSRKTGPKLWLLPYHYATNIGQAIRQKHADDPENWPLPTGTVFERWFKNADTESQGKRK